MGARPSRLFLFQTRNRENRNVFRVLVHRDCLPLGYGLLTISTDNVVLLLQQRENGEPTELEIIWPIRSIRRYGAEDGIFSIECGRRCQTGPALFTFSGKHTAEMFAQLRGRVAAIERDDELARMTEEEVRPHAPSSHEVYSNLPASTVAFQQLEGQYINCDSSGCYNNLLSNVSLYDRPVQDAPSVAYADLDLTRTATSSASNHAVLSSPISTLKTGIGDQVKCEYSVIDHLKTRAAVLSSRQFS